ncbi:MAG: TrmH family RNA methyltransferase [Rectinemataceae bacterium]
MLRETELGLLNSTEGTEFGISISGYALGIAKLLIAENETPEEVRAASVSLAEASKSVAGGTELVREELLRAVDALRHALLAATGQAPADWDLIDPSTGLPDPRSRRVFPGVKVYLEDLRSPFNIGSVFRTADAFGVEELILSLSCADPFHPRALRSAMGAIELLPWRRAPLESLGKDTPRFALELGGKPIDRFPFPGKGIAILGSEELGISREARDICDLGSVSIPMSGAKGSLNVAVAFGILMHAWTRSLVDPRFHLV